MNMRQVATQNKVLFLLLIFLFLFLVSFSQFNFSTSFYKFKNFKIYSFFKPSDAVLKFKFLCHVFQNKIIQRNANINNSEFQFCSPIFNKCWKNKNVPNLNIYSCISKIIQSSRMFYSLKNVLNCKRSLIFFKKIGISKLFAVFKNNQKCLRISTLQWVNKHFAVGNNQIQSSFPLASNGS